MVFAFTVSIYTKGFKNDKGFYYEVSEEKKTLKIVRISHQNKTM